MQVWREKETGEVFIKTGDAEYKGENENIDAYQKFVILYPYVRYTSPIVVEIENLLLNYERIRF